MSTEDDLADLLDERATGMVDPLKSRVYLYQMARDCNMRADEARAVLKGLDHRDASRADIQTLTRLIVASHHQLAAAITMIASTRIEEDPKNPSPVPEPPPEPPRIRVILKERIRKKLFGRS